MKAALAAVLLLAAPAARAGRSGAGEAHARAATGFPGALQGSLRAAQERPGFADAFPESFRVHLHTVVQVTSARAVAEHLRQASTEGQGLQALRGRLERREPLTPSQAGALVLANALYRPDQFPETLRRLDELDPAWGQEALRRLRGAAALREVGAPEVLAALRTAAAQRFDGPLLRYDAGMREVFDAPAAAGVDVRVDGVADGSAQGYRPSPDGRLVRPPLR